MKLVEVSGTPREIGRATGEALREEIRIHLDKPYSRIAPEALAVFLPPFIETTRRYLPAVLEELDGTAEGAGVSREEIYSLNCEYYNNDLVIEDGCTNIVFAEGPDGPVWGKNNDGMSVEERRPACARLIRRNDALPTVVFTFCGLVATTDGMNAEGLAMGHSSVGSVFQQSHHHPLIRLWAYEGQMRCRTTTEFVEHMNRVPLRGKGYSIVCVDRGGVTCSLEAPCPLLQVRRAEGSVAHMNCVNYYQLPHLAEADRRTPEGKQNAIRRREFLDHRLATGDDFSTGGMKAILRHHEPGICRHGDPDLSYTEYSMIGLPASGTVLYYDGNPCEGKYTRIEL